MGLLAAGSPRNGGGGIRMPTLMLGFLLVFAVVGYFGFERYRVQRDSEDISKRLEIAKRTETDLRHQVATLEGENMELQAKITSHLKDLERYKQATEEEVKMDAERADEIDSLKLQIKKTNQENRDLKERLKALEVQQTGKNNSATQAEEEKKQGEDKDHGLAAEDKSESEAEEQVNSATQDEEEAAKSGELDDRKREQQPQQQQQQQQQADKSDMDDLEKVDEEDLDVVKAEVAKVDENADIVADE